MSNIPMHAPGYAKQAAAMPWQARSPEPTADALRGLLEAAERREAEEAEREALKDRLTYETKLAHATLTLLGEVRRMRVEQRQSEVFNALADFRKELSPLAATYGMKIVLVGDKTRAALTYA